MHSFEKIQSRDTDINIGISLIRIQERLDFMPVLRS